MTPLQRMLDDRRAAFLQRVWWANVEYEKKAKAEIAAMAERDRRSLGQLFRHAVRRLALQQGEKT